MDWLVAPFDHKLPVELGEVSVTLPPEQKVVAPLVLIEIGFPLDNETLTGKLIALHVPDIDAE